MTGAETIAARSRHGSATPRTRTPQGHRWRRRWPSHLHWRLRPQAERRHGWFTVEQQAYADAAVGGRSARLDLLCTGYRPRTPRADNLAPSAGSEQAIPRRPFGHFAEAGPSARCRRRASRTVTKPGSCSGMTSPQALDGPGVSKDMLAALQDNGDVVAEGLPGPEFSRHMLNVDRLTTPAKGGPVSGIRAAPERRARPTTEPSPATFLDEAGRRWPRRHRRPHRGICPPAAVPGDRRAARHPRSRPAAPARLVPGAADRVGR